MNLYDRNLQLALTNPTAAGTMLNELNAEVARCRDANALASLLSRYVVVAAARQATMTAPIRSTVSFTPITSTRMQSISGILRQVSDAQNSILNNMK